MTEEQTIACENYVAAEQTVQLVRLARHRTQGENVGGAGDSLLKAALTQRDNAKRAMLKALGLGRVEA